jgi:hypothetical protein
MNSPISKHPENSFNIMEDNNSQTMPKENDKEWGTINNE